jgi:hypothetical protein
MKRILFIHVMALFCAVQTFAQNSLNSGDFVGGSWGTGQAMSASAGTSLIITKSVATTGDKYFRFFGDGSPCGEYQPNTNGDFFTHNVAVTAPNANCGNANAWRINVPTTTSNVVFKTDGGNDGMDRAIAYVIQGAVQSVSSVSQAPTSGSVFPGQAVTVTATLSGAFATGQAAYLRYTTDGYSTSTVVTMTGSGTSYSATIPASANTPGASLGYYLFTSGNTAPASNGSDADFSTINLNNNGGSNYTYTVSSGWTTAATGNWGTAATWTANAIPPTATNLGVVTINHSVTQNTAALASSIVINAAGTLTATANTLTISNNTTGTTFTNSGAMALSGTHAVTFAGTATHTVSGTATFNNINTTTGINFGSASTVNGNLTLNAGGFVSTNAPTYGAASTLTYNTGGVYGAGTEWTPNSLTGQGVPNNVTISTASTSVNFGSSTQYRRLRGSLTISASTTLALSTGVGGDLRIGGNWTNSGTFTANSRAVYFDGSAGQTINATASFPYLFIANTTANVTASAAVTVTVSLTIDASARLDMGTNALTITGATSSINGALRSALVSTTPITGASTTTLTFNNGGSYESNAAMAAVALSGLGIPIATWNSGSTCTVIGLTNPTAGGWFGAGLTQTFSNFTWNCTGQTTAPNMSGATITCSGTFTMQSTGTSEIRFGGATNGTITCLNFTQSGGTINCASGSGTGTINCSGTFNQTGGTITESSTGSGVININATSGNQNITQSGTINNTINWNIGTGTSTNTATLLTGVVTAGTMTVANNASISLGTQVVSGTGTFVASTGSTLITANTSGINTTGATGSVQTTTRTFTNTGVKYSYNGGSAQAAGTAIGAAASIANLTINNSAGVTLSSNVQSLTGTLTLTSGNLSLSTFDLNIGSAGTISGAGASKYLVTGSTGQLKKTALTTAFTFPVGNSAYNPITLTNSGTSDTYGIRVVDGALANANSSTLVVNRAWVVSEAVAGGSALTAVPQYNTGEEASGFNAGTTPYVGFWNGSVWSQASAVLAGSNPFTATAGSALSPSDITTGTQYFAIGKDNGLLQPAVDYTWNGSSDTDWGTSANWTPNGVPGSSDNVTISSPGTNTLSINSARTVINFTLSGTGDFTTTSAGSLTITGTLSSTSSATPSLNCASTVTISSGSSQTIPAWNFGNLNASGGARVLASSGTIGVCGTFTPGAGAYTVTGSTVNFNGTGAQTINAITYNNLTVSGNRGGAAVTLPSGTITVGGNGSYTGSNTTWVNTGNTVVYNGVGAQTVAAIPGYNNLTISGARGSAVVTLEAGTIGVAGTFSPSATAVTYSSTGNTFDYTSTSAQSIVAFNKYNNLSNSGNGARTLPTAATVVVDGTYTPTTGAITVSTSVIDFSSASSQNIPASSYYTITNTGNGNRVWASTGNIDISGNFTPGTGTHTITGSTVRFLNTAAGPTTIPVVTTNIAGSSYNNVVINGSNAVPSVYSIAGTTVGIAGDLTVTAGHMRFSSGGTSGTLNVNGTLTVNGGSLILTNSGTVTDVGTLNLFGNLVMNSGTISRVSGVANGFINFANATSTQTWTYTGGSFSILSGFGIPVNVGTGSSTNTLQLASNVTASSITVNVLSGATLDFGTNVFASAGGMSFNAASGSNLITANTGGFAATGASGSVQSTGSRTYNAGANYTYNGTAAQATGTGFTGANNLIINNTSGATPAITLSASATVSGVLTLTSGIVQLGANNLTVSNTATSAISGAFSTRFIQTNSTGELRRAIAGSIASSTTYDYPVGTSTNYTPASFTFTATGNAFTLHNRAVAATHPSMDINGTQTDYFANRYWTTNTSGTPNTYSYSSALTYISGDLQGTAANVRLNKWAGSWSMDNSSSATSTSLTSGGLNETSFSLASTAEWTGRVNPTIETYTWTGTNSSSWTDPGNWSPGTSAAGPAFIDNIIISSSGTNTLNITGTRSITDMTVSGTGTFTITSGDTLVVIGSITSTTSATPSMACGSLVQITSTSSQTIPAWSFGDLDASGGSRTLASSGTIGICGAFTRGAGAYTVTGSTVDFNGTGAQTIPAGTYNNLTISQNRGAATVTLASGTIDVAGAMSATLTNFSAVSTGNTVNFSSASSQAIPAFNYNNITNTGNGARTWANSGVIDVNGTFTFGTGAHTTTGSTVRYSTTAAGANTLSSFTSANSFHYHNLELVGGATTTWVLASGFSPSISGNLSLTGAGTFTLATNATANSMSVGGDLTVSGTGTLRVANTSTAALVNTLTVTGNTTVSNGVLNLVGSTSNTTVQGNLVTTDLTVSGTGQLLLDAGSNTAVGAATVNGNFTMTSTTTNAVNFGSGAGSNTGNLISIKGNFLKSGTGTIGISGGFATTAGFNFNGTGTQTWSHSGTAMTGGTITIAAGATLQLLSNMASASSANTNAITVTGTLDCGTFSVIASNATNTFVLSGTGTLKTASATGVAGAVSGFTAAPTFTTGATFEFNGTNPSTGFTSFTGITTTNVYTLNWSGTGSLTLDKSVQLNALNLVSSGLFYMGNFDVTMTSTATIGGSPFSSSKMIVTNGTGYLVRSHTAAGVGIPFTWPIGDTTGVAEFSPVTVNNISVALAGSLAYRVVDGVHPNMSPAASYASRYWPSRYTGSTYNYTNATFTYAASDIVTGPEISFVANVWDPVNSAWLDFTATSSATGNVLTVTSGPTSTVMPAGVTQYDFAPRIPVPVYYRSVATGSWATASTWEVSSDPAFVSPAAVAATFAPNAANSNGVAVRNGHTVTSSASTSIDQLTIESGGVLSITNNAFTIANGTGTDLQINSGGTAQISAGLSASLVIATGAAMQVDGLFKMTGTGTNPTVSAVGTINVSATGTYEHNVNAGTIPTCTWQTGSTCLVTGSTANAPSGLAQAFHHFTVNSTITASVNCSGALQTINGKFKLTTNSTTFGWRLSATTGYTLNVADSLIITNGILDVVSGTIAAGSATINANGPVVMNGATSQFTKTGSSTATININNNFTQNAGIIEFNAGGSSNTTWNIKGDFVQGGTIQRTNGGTHTLSFNKASGTQTWTQTGSFGTGALVINVGGATTNTLQLLSNIGLGASSHTFNVTNGATLNMGPYNMTGAASTFALGATGAVKLGDANGIVTAPTASGNVRTLVRTFPATASYFYNGTANQVTGNALPATLTTTGNLNIEAATGVTVTLTTNNTTVPTFNLISGIFAAGTGQNINLSNGGVVNATGGDFATGTTAGTITATGTATFNGNSNPYNVYASGGVNFGAQTVTIQNGGTFRINSGGFVNTNAPFYGTGSTLQYWVGATYGRNLEWSATSGRGYPHHVQVSNNTTLNPAGTAAAQASTPLRTAGNVTIDSGSAMYMDSGSNNMIEDLVVGGNMILIGAMSGSQTSGSDIFVAGNWQNDGTSANFFPNSRAVFLNGTGTQTISGTNASFPAFPFLFIDKTAGSVSLSRDIQVTESLNFTSSNVANIVTGSNVLFVSKNTTTAIDRQGTGHVVGNLRRAVTTGSNTYAYPVGDATTYSPVSLALNNVTASGNITASTTSGDHPQIASSGLDNSKSVNRFYTLSNSGVTLTNYDATFTFASGDLDVSVNTANLLVGRYSSSWSYPAVGTLTSTSTQATALTAFGDFALAECRTPVVSTLTGGGSYCASASGVDISLDGSELGVSYQLQRNGSAIGSSVSGTGSSLSFGNQTLAGTYTAVANSLASNSCSSSMTGSLLVTITATVAPSVTIATTATTICTGSSVTFTATPQFGGVSPTYQWKLNGSNVGTNSDSYTTTGLVNGDVVSCEMTSSEACPLPATVSSNSITMSVFDYGTPTLTIAAAGTSICAGDVVTITSSATFEGTLPTYDWKVNGTSTGNISSSFSSFSLVNGDQVSCVLTSDYLCANSPTATSNTLTFVVATPPQVDAGANMTTCGTTPFTFANGATNNNTTSIAWTENGAGSITSGANTLTPTYTPAAGDLGTTVTFTLTGYGDSPCAEIADNVSLQIDALTLYYSDVDGDGFGDPLSSPVASCTPVAGRVADNTDCCDSNANINPVSEWWADADGDGVGGFIYQIGCISGCSGPAQTIPYYPPANGGLPYTVDCNDDAASAYPGAGELCGNSIDDDCDQTIDEGCSGIANDGFANAVVLNVSSSAYPQCTQVSGSILNADISGEGNPANVSVGGGRDSWYRFVAPSTAAQIRVVPNGFNAVIELRTAAHPVGQVDVENVNSAIGGTEIMNVSGLTQGQTYYIAVRNHDATAGGTFTICVSPLLPSGCGTAQAVGGLNLCSSFKAIYRGATSYTFNFTGTGGTAPTPYVTTSATSSGLMPLSTASLALRNGGVYSVRVDANFALTNGIGGADPIITLQGTSCSRTMAAAPLMEVMASQRCVTATLNRSSLLRAVTTTGQSSACSAVSYNFRFTRVADCAGTAIPGEVPFVRSSSSTYLSLNVAFPNGTFPMPNIGYWKVEIAPVFSYGATAYGPSQTIKVNNTAASMMLPEVAQSEERMDVMESMATVYPNPGNGQHVVVSTDTESVVTNWNVIDELGRKVEGYSIISMDGSRYEVSFPNTLANGLYYISWFADGEVKSVRWLVAK